VKQSLARFKEGLKERLAQNKLYLIHLQKLASIAAKRAEAQKEANARLEERIRRGRV